MNDRNKFIVFFLALILVANSLTYTTQAASPYISRQEAQDRALKMAYSTWYYDKSLNGNTQSYIELPPYLKDKANSLETGIPYNYGGSDGFDTTSNIQWSNFFDAIKKGATAGNIRFEGGYKGETAGIDAASFIQSTLKISGIKLTTNTLLQYLTPISFDQLTNMDILLLKGGSAAFFQSWVYDDLGNIIGAVTLEATIENNDGTGQKVKEYYRSKDNIINNYKPYRYKYIGSDFIESNSAQPTIVSPVYRQAIDKADNQVSFKWYFNSTNNSGYQTAYRIRVYRGSLVNSSSTSGVLVKEFSQGSNSTEVTISFKDLPEDNYYFILETKNNNGYWSSPSVVPFSFTTNSSSVPYKITAVNRFGGATRYETSRIIAENNFKGYDMKNVVIASGNNFPDGLSGVTLARRLNAPLLLVDNNPEDSGSQAVLQYILQNLKKDGNIYILGGQGAVSSSYVEYLTQRGYIGTNIVRIGGMNRNETSVNIAKKLNLTKGTPVVIANDSSFADALSISSKAGSSQMPILLTSKDSLNKEVEDYIKDIMPSKVYIIGETGAISENVKNRISEITSLSDSKIVRLGGQTRYDTSEKINNYFYQSDFKSVYVAVGENFPDSLSGSAAAAFNNGAPLVLVSDNSYVTSARTINYLTGNNKVTLNIFGGDRTVTNYLISRINTASMRLQ
ncbi:cell wall-binding repeat-containing protein [Clostridium magnum]|uniref:N-acetylmuramoyl-L-alanine amidase LytC n=1 Tax=Clostridium magnum DSM 2767 TaxID=1121326 RepID=A0A162RNZ2_9CLOT|nr:cell wall-binding repeat-containing protein [Clostridium magnum]KZL90183.1 N-acetylmuramoyl-L-alanine amidase LytC precursor [Clostridium magnum DSM 2767]SHH63622.1 Putative cell wall binding repeat 2 [Clostridium magnum DSM 2767]